MTPLLAVLFPKEIADRVSSVWPSEHGIFEECEHSEIEGSTESWFFWGKRWIKGSSEAK